MRKFSLLALLFMFMNINEVKTTDIQDGVDVVAVQTSIQNSSDYRDHSISADITGNTLTINFNEDVGIAQIVIRNSIEGLRTTDNGLLTKTKTKTKAKVFSNSFGLSQQPWSTSNYKLSTDYKLYTERRMRYAATANFQL